ncbi:MAG: hypothetical protein P4L74_06305 [Candidatus Doudnabacteria bacterium]|nr:hypothetical protein [Candidatus Doudnabacteria bacterium]
MKKILFALPFILLLASGCSSENNQTSQSLPTASNSSPQFTTTTVADMVQGGMEHTPTLVETQTKILKKITFLNKKATPPTQEYLFEIGDSKAVAVFDVSKFSQLYSQFNAGNSVVVRGAFGSFSCDTDSMAGDAGITYLCKTLNTTQIFIPWVVAIAPDPTLGNKNPVEKITQ